MCLDDSVEVDLGTPSEPVGPMATPQGVTTIHLEGTTRGANGRNALSLGGHVRGGSAGVMLIEKLMVDLDDSASSNNFDDFGDLGKGSDLGLEEKPVSLLDYLRTQRERVMRSHFHRCPGYLFAWSSRCMIVSSTSWAAS